MIGGTYSWNGKLYFLAEMNAQEMRNEDGSVHGLVLRVNNIPKGMSKELYDHLRPIVLQFLVDKEVIPKESEQVQHMDPSTPTDPL